MSGNKIYKVCIIGLEHTHARMLYSIFQRECKDRIEWIGYASVAEFPEGMSGFKQEIYKPIFDEVKEYDNYIRLLEQKPDIAIICTDTKMHAEICEETLCRNIHTIVEKPMALNLEDALKMYRAAKESSAELIINWPVAWFPNFVKANELADSGIIGETLRFVYRTPATRGPFKPGYFPGDVLSKFWWYDAARGGGSIGDYACYGCALATWFIKEKLPVRVAGFRKNFMMPFSNAEDYSSFLVEYENAVAFAEGSWSTVHSGEIPTGPIVYGTEGTIVADRYSNIVKVYRTVDGEGQEPEVFEVPESGADVALNFLNHLDYGTDLHEMITLEFNMRAMTVLDACIRSAESGMVIPVQKTW